MKEKRKMVEILESTHNEIKKKCSATGVKIRNFIDKILREGLKKETKKSDK